MASADERRVAITGVGLLTPIGATLDAVSESLRGDASGVRTQASWSSIGHLATRLGGEVGEVPLTGRDRKKIRSMGRVARLALVATDDAVADAGLTDLTDPRVGLAYGSTHGSSSAYVDFARPLFARDSFEGLPSTSYLKFMSHTCAANLASYYGVRGRVISTCAACVSGSQAIGAGVEAIRAGRADAMICGGAEELHWTHAGVFDVMMATSTRYNDRPSESPRPFDADRDGLVVAEGAATVVLERMDLAKARGATIHAELLGYGTNCDGTHVTNPSADGMARAIRLALEDARLPADAIGYVNAHATATDIGDLVESQAMHSVFGAAVPVSSSKGFLGHTLGACGAIEVALCLAMMRDGFLAPTKNLARVDPRCAPLDHVIGAAREARPRIVMTNNFAFGGINTSLILGSLG
ncbi:MAG: beta-ketoacyl-ACP synthase [Sandaracinaceae bacterium]|nr:beta-ketoacyl-ACP synthase [Sandaracinaceae bacterium]